MKRIVLYMILGLVFIGFVYGASDFNDAIVCLNFDGDYSDEKNTVNITTGGEVNLQTTYKALGTGAVQISKTGSCDYLKFNVTWDELGLSNLGFTVSFWVWHNSSEATNMEGFLGNYDTSNGAIVIKESTGKPQVIVRNGATLYNQESTQSFNNNAWEFWYFTIDTTNVSYWKNGTSVDTDTGANVAASTQNNDIHIGMRPDTNECGGIFYIDEVVIYDTIIGHDQILENKNVQCSAGGVPGSEPPDLDLVTNLTSNIESNENPFTFSIDSIGNVDNTTDIWNITVYYNGTVNQTHLNIANLNTTKFIINLTYGSFGLTYDINVTVNHAYDQAHDSILRTNITLDSVPPNVTVSSNVVNNSVLFYNIDSIDHTFTGFDVNLYAMNVSYIRLNPDGSYNITVNNSFVENINTTTYLINYSGNNSLDLFQNKYYNGTYKIDIWAWDDHTEDKIKDYKVNKSDNSLLFEDVVLIEGDELLIKKVDYKKKSDRYIWEFDFDCKDCWNYLDLSSDHLVYRKDSENNAHFVDLWNRKWIDFNSDQVSEYYIEKLDLNKYRINFYNTEKTVFFESIGDLNEYHAVYYFNVSNPFTFSAVDVFTNATVTNFTIDVFNASDFSLIQSKSTNSSYIHFNITDGLNYISNFSSDNYANNNSGNISFKPNANFTYYVFASNSLYLFVYDEITDQLITDRNVTIDIINYDNESVTQTSDTGSLFYSGLSPGTYQLRYKANDYNTRSYYTTISDSSTQQIELFLLNTSEATYVSFIVEDETGNTLEGTTVQAYRHFTDCNCFKVVEMDKSNFNGIAVLSLQQHEANYRFIVLNTDGTTIYSSTSEEGYKITGSSYTLSATLLGDTTESFFGTTNLYYNLSWSNTTKSFYFTVNDPTALIDQFCVYVDQYNLASTDGKQQICSNCVSASSGTAVCNVSDYYSNGREMIAKAWLHTNTEFSEVWIDTLSIFSNLESVNALGNLGVFLGTFLIVSGFFAGLVLAGLGGAIILFNVVLIFVAIMKLIVISTPILFGVMALSVIIIYLTGDK